MANFNVMVTLTRTIEYSVEIEVKAKDEEAAQAKVEAMVAKANVGDDLIKELDFEETSCDDSFDYSVSEG